MAKPRLRVAVEEVNCNSSPRYCQFWAMSRLVLELSRSLTPNMQDTSPVQHPRLCFPSHLFCCQILVVLVGGGKPGFPPAFFFTRYDLHSQNLFVIAWRNPNPPKTAGRCRSATASPARTQPLIQQILQVHESPWFKIFSYVICFKALPP